MQSDPLKLSRAWALTRDELLVSFRHGLNNRLASVSGIAELADFQDDVGSVVSMLKAEVPRFARILDLFGLLLDRAAATEPLLLSDLVADLLDVYRWRHDAPQVVFDPGAADLPPVVVERSALSRIVLVTLRMAERASLSTPISVKLLSARGGQVCIVIARGAAGVSGSGIAAEGVELETWVPDVAAAAAGMGGEFHVEQEGGSGAVQFRLCLRSAALA